MSLLARFQREHASRSSTSADEGTHTPSNNSGLYFPPSSPAGEGSASLEPPPPAQYRRGRSNSAEAKLERESEQRRKRHCAAQVCRDLDLQHGTLDAFTNLDVPAMLITIFGKLIWLERERTKSEDHSFIKSEEFKDVLQAWVRTALLSANLSHYLNGLNDQIWSFLKNNLTVFCIPPHAMEDARLIIYIDSLLKDVLTKQRSQIKTKARHMANLCIMQSIQKCQHISELAKSLTGRDHVDVTLSQWARFAFLRQNYILFSTLVDEAMVKKYNPSRAESGEDSDNNDEREVIWSSHQFWEFIDQLLDEMREAVHDEPDVVARRTAWEKYFNETLQSDLDQFPLKGGAECRPSDGRHIAGWQRAMHRDLSWL